VGGEWFGWRFFGGEFVAFGVGGWAPVSGGLGIAKDARGMGGWGPKTSTGKWTRSI
jgi:hypothetical protein